MTGIKLVVTNIYGPNENLLVYCRMRPLSACVAHGVLVCWCGAVVDIDRIEMVIEGGESEVASLFKGYWPHRATV